MPKVSVIIPTHSRPHLLPRAVDSARKAGKDVEIIVVDDASTDETAEVCKTLKDIRYIRLSSNLGVAGARNAGILASRAEYITFLDDDDIRLPDTLYLQLEALQDNPEAALAYGRSILADDNLIPIGKTVPEHCPSGDVFWRTLAWELVFPGCVIRKSCFAKVGLLDGSIPGVDDIDISIRLTEQFPVVAVDQSLIIYRQAGLTSKQGSSNPAPILSLAIKMLNDRWLHLPRALKAPSWMRRDVKRRFLNRVSDVLICTAADALKHGVNDLARENLLTAIRLNTLRSSRLWTLKLLAHSLVPYIKKRDDKEINKRSLRELSMDSDQ